MTKYPKGGDSLLIELLSKEKRIMFEDNELNWEESIKLSSSTLLKENVIKESYVRKMIDNVHELGPYIVIAPKIALAHARPEDGVNEIGLSLLISKKSIHFSEKDEHSANLIFTLAAVDSDSHLTLLSDLANIFADQNNIDFLCNLNTKNEVLDFINLCLGGNQ